MPVIPSDSCIHSVFEPAANRSPDFPLSEIEVFFVFTKDLHSRFSDLNYYISEEEQLRADRFHSVKDKETYITCHGLLRSILCKILVRIPSEVVFHYDKYNKPALAGNPVYFNITNSRDAFAFVISENYYAGIDMEKTNRSMDIVPLMKTCFSEVECRHISASGVNDREKFFLLWTRKEALLKAIGTGIINNLTQIQLSERENVINRKSFDDNLDESVFDEHFIYSEKLSDYYLSIAIPQKARISLTQINEENVISYLA